MTADRFDVYPMLVEAVEQGDTRVAVHHRETLRLLAEHFAACVAEHAHWETRHNKRPDDHAWWRREDELEKAMNDAYRAVLDHVNSRPA